MLIHFFRLAAHSPTRQRTVRVLAILHVLVLTALAIAAETRRDPRLFSWLGDAVLLLAIIDGAILVGWRLAQWPKSRALEPLLLANCSSTTAMLGEQFVGLSLLALVTVSSIPILLFSNARGFLAPQAVWLLPAMGLACGSIIGFAIIVWVYETASVRRWGQRALGACLAVYLIVGGLAGEHTLPLLRGIPYIGNPLCDAIWGFHYNHPFSLVHRMDGGDPLASSRAILLLLFSIPLLALLMMRSAARLQPHYVERHYRPIQDDSRTTTSRIGDAPLSWWAVRRVSEYAGRVNIYLAWAATLLYSLYLLSGPAWPQVLSTRIFTIFDQWGGPAGLGVVLVLLAAVPAAYQYGLWESSKSDRCRRLEVFLTTDLSVSDYLAASWSASWSRGRSYFLAAVLLWSASAASGRIPWAHALLAIASGLSLISCYFALGFRALSRSGGGTFTGFILSVALPLATWGLAESGQMNLARLSPPGTVYFAASDPDFEYAPLVILATLLIPLVVLRQAERSFDGDIRRSFEADLLSI